MAGPYDVPETFRIALETRLRNAVQSRGADLQRLRRRVAFERLLARLFMQDDPPWLLKGGYALELRLRGRARSTLDLDISVPDPGHPGLLAKVGEGVSPMEMIYEHLQRIAEQDLGDGFSFLIARPKKEQAGAPAGSARCSVDARLAGRTFVRFRLDIGLGDPVLNQPDWLEGDTQLAFAGIPAARVAVYPLDQQFAEKIHAYWQRLELRSASEHPGCDDG